MNNPLYFISDLLQQPMWVVVWLGFLMAVNFASLYFWANAIGKIIFTTFMLSVMLVMGLYAVYGYEKVLGFGHILWIPLFCYVG